MTNVGYRELAIFDAVQNVHIPAWVLYPTATVARTERFGPYPLDVARDAPVLGDDLPLVVASHGTGGTPWGLRGLAMHLARASHVVVMIAHPGNTKGDNALAEDDANLVNRPRHVRVAIDSAFADTTLGPRLRPATAAVIGHSMGGYTALAVAGGRPMNLPKAVREARHMIPDAELARLAYPIETEPDPRVRAVVLLAPAVGWFMAPGALSHVTIPVFVRTGERDALCTPTTVATILDGLPDATPVNHGVVANAGHFSFQAVYPPEMVRPDFYPAHDPPGFDRAAFQPTLYAEITTFLRELR